jgi:hypothetical protein
MMEWEKLNWMLRHFRHPGLGNISGGDHGTAATRPLVTAQSIILSTFMKARASHKKSRPERAASQESQRGNSIS